MESRIAETVRTQYRAHDVEAAGAWVWTGPDGVSYVMVDVESAVQGIVQGRAELWMANEQQAQLFGRSEAMPSVAELGAYSFTDLTGDTIPDFFGYVADSSGISYPVFFPGAHPGMNEEIAISAPGWHFATDDEHLPQTWGPPGRPCALQLWADDSLPDSAPAGWRWLSIHRTGELGAPARSSPDCGPGQTAPGVQPRP